jgi:hypothetical protein
MIGRLPKKWQVNIETHPDYAKTDAAYMAGKLSNEQLFEAFRKMKFDLVKPGYFEYVEKKRQRELRIMFG